ncbi:hypothetical protein PHSY_005817 [Pseudozyma hubeiensis SY62]|uniref:Uncharacterized protein n=1 Tax=Pseudozyma hubeiensis (strain SY62) TaxID=1305764 RepID=R9PA22_PSEHS|nr:hypothetical protein PHSY_005817 [Pseudozyma hubeiensis SY62]GAC98228.1 hypothetical protein PHSY_005817 [Pseudozyma hubeiensis SY62]
MLRFLDAVSSSRVLDPSSALFQPRPSEEKCWCVPTELARRVNGKSATCLAFQKIKLLFVLLNRRSGRAAEPGRKSRKGDSCLHSKQCVVNWYKQEQACKHIIAGGSRRTKCGIYIEKNLRQVFRCRVNQIP